MKKFVFILFVFSAISFVTHAQKDYSLENLQNLSQEELDVYLNKALKLQKSGKTVTIVGGSILGATAATIAGVAMFAEDDWALGAVVIGFFGGLAGLGTMGVGIPMKVTGKNRVERIGSFRNSAFNDVRINIQPCAQYNLITQNYNPGITFKITF